ncbi:hypothetical protein ACQP2T_61410 [Nonomuraea sp. CA-143628]|uniref:hypothetical protein n=1 Tax=Nonomuraea sp. CA-143628 TaxID=3239997 RepID=UPI003D8DB065
MTIWTPYADKPLFTAELIIGPEAMSEHQLEQLTGYLEALASRRGVLHTAVAFNAVYFGYDLDYGGYTGGPVDFDRLPEARPDAPAPPVGAMVRLAAGQEPLFGEVLYAEGAHPALYDDGEVEPWLSGAPRDASGPGGGSEPRDRLVVDFDAFGQGVITTRERLARLRRKGRLLDDLGHLLLPARLRTGFAEFLLGAARQCLITGPLPLLLGTDADDTDLQAGVYRALRTLDAVLSNAPGLRRWGPYAFPREMLAIRFADGESELGGADLGSIVNGMIQPPSATRRNRPAGSVIYTAVGPRLRTFAANQAALEGVAYAVAVCHTNAVLSDVARREADEGGALPSGGHLRLDDARQGGGVWRVSHPAGPHASLDPLLPLGLGWLESLPPAVDGDLQAAEPAAPERLTITDSQIDWTTPLRLRHHTEGTLPLPARLAGELKEGTVRLRLRHQGYNLDPDEADQEVRVEYREGGLSLTGVCWPLEYFPGILLDFWWPRGAPTLNAGSTLLDIPIMLDGELIEHRYDPGIVTRERAPGCVVRGPAGPLELRERILRAVRRAGLLQADGGVVLPERMLARAVFGDPTAHTIVLSAPLAQLLTDGVLHRSVASRGKNGALTFPAALGESEIPVLVWQPMIVPVREVASGQETHELAVRLKGHEVRSFLRRLRPSERASDIARTEYRQVADHFGFGPELPVGYTIVRAHRRGG